MSQTVSARLKYLAATKGDATFCTFIEGNEIESISFAQLFARSCAYAQRYIELGVAAGDLVIVVLKHSPHLFYSYIGAMIAGAIPSYLPFPTPKQRPELYWEDHDRLFARIEPRLIVTYQENLDAARRALPAFAVPALIADDALLVPAPQMDYPGFARAADDIACLQHSSGTTSLKKGVMLTHRMIFDHVNAYNASIDFSERDSIASWLPLYHDMGFVACFMGSLLSGTHLVALDPFEWVVHPRKLLDAIERYRTTFCWLPNFAFSHIANAARANDRWDLSVVRAFINCSEPCKAATFDRFAARFAACGIAPEQLHVCYAMAENVFGVTQTRLGRRTRVIEADKHAFSLGTIRPVQSGETGVRLVSCGEAIAGVEIEIRGDDGKVVPEGRIGEICVKSAFLFSGYYRMPEKTAERLRDGWYSTADMGFVLDGELFVTGRKDDMIIVAGRNYYAHEIEAHVNATGLNIPGRTIAIGVEDARTDSTAVVVLAEFPEGADTDAAAQTMRRDILEAVGLTIHAVVPLSAGQLVKTTSGKISRSKNKELYDAGKL